MAMSSSTDSPITVYLAEKQTAIREALVAYLMADARLKVLGHSGDGARAVEECQQLKPMLLVTDVDLSGLNGISICRKLAATATKVLIFTSNCDIVAVRQLVEAGALGVVEKSGNIDTVMRAIEATGSGQAFFGEHVTQLLQQYLREFRSPQAVDSLSLREREVLQSIAEGRSNKQVATQLGISAKTVENHRFHLMHKLCAHNSADLTREAFRLGMVRNPE
jgi:DNA-binding NarL/FixJ family response regulator